MSSIAAIEEKKKYLLHWMYDFIEDDDEPAYKIADVDEFDQLISTFVQNTTAHESRTDLSWLKIQTESLINELKCLNEKHSGYLIEADQREDISALIDLVAQYSGHENIGDITELWQLIN